MPRMPLDAKLAANTVSAAFADAEPTGVLLSPFEGRIGCSGIENCNGAQNGDGNSPSRTHAISTDTQTDKQTDEAFSTLRAVAKCSLRR